MDQVKGTPKSLKQHVGEQLRFYKRKWKKDEELWITKNISSTVVRRKLEEQLLSLFRFHAGFPRNSVLLKNIG